MARYFLTLALATLVALVVAEQPEAVAPVTGPQRKLPIGQLNFLQTTDIHGWYAGHLNQGQYSADFGDYLSFIDRMREKIEARGLDLIVVDTGDRVDGNGLYDASNPKGLYTYDIAKEVNYDVMILGNHELYHNNSVESERKKLVSALKDRYISSNVDYIDPETGKQVPLGQRYRIFRTKNQKIKIAAFGFMFNFLMNSNNTYVQRVEDTVKERWFQAAIREDVDLFLICGHIPLDEPEFKIIHQAIRSQKKDTPIQIFGAHSHIRNYVKYDSKAYGLQSGQYLETIGWASVSGVKKNAANGSFNEVSFRRRYIDNNILAYHFHTGLNATTFPTDHGKNISSFIHDARQKLHLDDLYGCVPKDLYFKTSYLGQNDSILTWLVKDVLPDIVKTKTNQANDATMILLNTKFIRYDLFKGPFTRDTRFIITPFENEFRFIKNVPYDIAIDTYNRLLKDDELFNLGHSAQPLSNRDNTSIMPRLLRLKPRPSRLSTRQNQISFSSSPTRPLLVPGYTTDDDAGSNGDDTLHTPLGKLREQERVLYAPVQFPFNGDPQTVDFVFSEYIQTPILTAFNDKGLHFNINDVMSYREESISELIYKWIQRNWHGKC
ncbi:Secreted protein [Erysiphe neolycopersici]|uniref:Secreted protein n=1 Tax=Erysiphe neolycopersici TaxID=212602 RepID=A0A420H8H7_9PEZI|nr:Secreted protein [Erysiphe neolycopersici]